MSKNTPAWLRAMMALGSAGFQQALWRRWGLVNHPRSLRAFRRSSIAIEELQGGGSELDALLLCATCNYLFHHFDFRVVTWEDAPDDLLERITGNWLPEWNDPKIEVTNRYRYVATVLNLTRWPNWDERDALVRKIFVLSYGEPLGGVMADDDDRRLGELLYDIAWHRR